MNFIIKYLTFIKYFLVSGLSFLIDITLFTIFNKIFKSIILGTIISRIISSFINYLLNRNKVFKSSEKNTLYKYYLLVLIQMLVSATLVDKLYTLVSINPTIIKVPVELLLFLCNYIIQKYYIFKTSSIPNIINNHLKFLFLSFLSTFSVYSYILLYINNSYLKIILILLIYIIFVIFYKLLYKNIKLSKIYNLFTIILSFILVLGYSYEITSTGNLLWGNLLNFMLSLIKILGFYFFFKTLVYYFNQFLSYKFKIPKSKLLKEFSKHPFRYSFLLLSIFYGIYLIIYYPGIINYDNANQIKEVLGLHTRYLDAINPISNSTLTNFNPIIHTLLIGLPVKLGIYLNNFNFGLFIASLIQLIIIITIYSYIISYTVKMKVNPIYSLIILLIMCLFPTIDFYSITLVKDTIYTALLALFSLQIYDYLKNKNEYHWNNYLILFLISILVCLFRNNGIYIVIITLLFLMFKDYKKKIVVLLMGILAFNIFFSNILLPTFKISNTSIREALSVPFQQTARVVKYNNESLTKEDIAVISKILDYENMAKDYDEDLADPIKNKFNKDYEINDLINYFKVWFKGLFKNPLIYIDATINNISGYFNPFENGWKIYFKLNPDLPKAGFNYHYNNLKSARNFLQNFEIIFEISPLGWLTNVALITWLNILLFLNLINKKRDYILLLPSIISILFCILSPMNLYFRYIYPSFIILIILFPIIKSIKETEK